MGSGSFLDQGFPCKTPDLLASDGLFQVRLRWLWLLHFALAATTTHFLMGSLGLDQSPNL
jgi:hypothetical protein